MIDALYCRMVSMLSPAFHVPPSSVLGVETLRFPLQLFQSRDSDISKQ